MGKVKTYKILHLPTATYMYMLKSDKRKILNNKLNRFYSYFELDFSLHGYTIKEATPLFTKKEATGYIKYWSIIDDNRHASIIFEEEKSCSTVPAYLFEIVEVE